MSNDNTIENELKYLFALNHIKYTEQRAIVLKIFLSTDKHLTADELQEIIKKQYPEQNIGIATIYRTLGILEEHNLISYISFGTDGKRYESKKDTHHDHMICTKCGKIIEFFDEQIEQKQEQIAKENGFVITNHTMQLFGLCSECQNQN